MEEQNVFPGQVEYRDKIENKGLKKGSVANKLKLNKAVFSQFINGRLYMPISVRDRLDLFLDKYPDL